MYFRNFYFQIIHYFEVLVDFKLHRNLSHKICLHSKNMPVSTRILDYISAVVDKQSPISGNPGKNVALQWSM